jgi:L-aspartate oxidase
VPIVTEGRREFRNLSILVCSSTSAKAPATANSTLQRRGPLERRNLARAGCDREEIEETLLRELGRQSHVDLLENHMAVDLITAAKLGFAAEDRCLGVYVLDEKTGKVETIRSDCVVLATGGCGKVYLYTTNPDVATGDGVAMGWRAGAAIANMEFMQFHPTCLFTLKQNHFSFPGGAARAEFCVTVVAKIL